MNASTIIVGHFCKLGVKMTIKHSYHCNLKIINSYNNVNVEVHNKKMTTKVGHTYKIE